MTGSASARSGGSSRRSNSVAVGATADIRPSRRPDGAIPVRKPCCVPLRGIGRTAYQAGRLTNPLTF